MAGEAKLSIVHRSHRSLERVSGCLYISERKNPIRSAASEILGPAGLVPKSMHCSKPSRPVLVEMLQADLKNHQNTGKYRGDATAAGEVRVDAAAETL